MCCRACSGYEICRAKSKLSEDCCSQCRYFESCMEEPTEVYELAVSGPRIYLATQVGLYEGDEADSTRFSVILKEDTRALHFADALWVGCGGNELYGSGLRYAYSGQSWNSYYNNCIWSAAISDCAVDSAGDIYLCHYDAPISAIDSTGRVSLQWGVLPRPFQVRIDSRGRVWFAHFASDGGLSVYDPSDGTWQKVQWGASSSWNIIDALAWTRLTPSGSSMAAPPSWRLTPRTNRPCFRYRGWGRRRAVCTSSHSTRAVGCGWV